MEIHYEAMSGLMADPHLFSTIRAGIVDPGTGELEEAIYDKAAKYCADIAKAIEAFHSPEYPSNDLMQYFSIPEDSEMEAAIKAKVRSARVTVETAGGSLFARLDLDIVSDLTAVEFESFADQIAKQYRDGWGAEFELSNIPAQTDLVYLRLWHDDVLFFTGAVKETFMR